MSLTSSRQVFNNSGVSLSAGNLPAVTCQEHICSESPLAHQVWSAAQSAAALAVIVHAAPHPGAQCFTILIQRETFSQLLRLPSLCFATDKKKERKSMKPRINRTPPSPSPSAPFLKDDVKFNSENSCSLTWILPTNWPNSLWANFHWEWTQTKLTLNTWFCVIP